MKLALFDLDHTLIPFDSGMAWTRFLVGCGRLPAAAAALYLDRCQQYVAGRLDIQALHRASMAPLLQHPVALLAQWALEFEKAIAPRLPAAQRALVQRHQAEGDLCAIVTATTRLIAEPVARGFGIVHLLATEAVVAGVRYSGEIDGEPCVREHKVHRVHAWLQSRGLRLESFETSCFYSDSISDLPLLRAVTHPVAVDPDERLREQARESGWRVIEFVAG
ncbi:MAG: HAD family hydrolase [Rubrivivax sp.]